MKHPGSRAMILGHPVISTPAMLSSGALLLAGFYGGSGVAVIIAIAMIGMVHNATSQARKYRQRKREWDAMSDEPDASGPGFFRVVLVLVVACAMLVGFSLYAYHAAFAAGYAVVWVHRHPIIWAVPAIAVIGKIGLRILRRRGGRPGRMVAVKVVARSLLPTPTIADAYRALPAYCHALLRDGK